MLETLERLIFDPVSEVPPYQVASNRPLEITGRRAPSPEGHGIFLVDHQYPRPEMQSTFASSRDSQGEARFGKPRFGNRKIPIKVYISEAQGVGAVTNLVTNSTGEVAKKFTDGADYPVTRELGINGVPALLGEYRDKHAYDGSNSSTSMGTFPLAFPAAGSYVISIFVWIPSNWTGGAVRLQSAGSYAGSSAETVTNADLTRRDEWQRINTKITIAGGDLVGTWRLDSNAQPATAGTGVLYSDAIQVESGSAPTAFLCGDTPGCYWNGTPHASTSTRVGSGSDRKRFIRSLYDLQEKIEKFADEGGTFKRILPDGSWMVFDVVEASFVGEWAKAFNQGQQEFSFELICKPGARLEPIVLTAHEEKTLPILKFTETDIPGNLPALGDLLIEDIQGVDRNFVAVSVASRFLDQSAAADVFYEAESRMRLSGAALAAGSGTPSGSEANKVVNCPLFEEFTPYLSSRSSAGAYTSHVSAQKVIARVWRPTSNIGAVSLRYEYAQGDLLRWKPLEAVNFEANANEGMWTLVDLGVVRLNRATVGTQRWEGRLNAKSTVAGDSLHVDWIAFMPVEEFYGEARALTVQSTNIGAMFARDNFSQSPGALTGKTATVGGNWSFLGGDADDFTLGVPGWEGRAFRQPAAVDVSGEKNDPAASFGSVTGRYMRLGTGVLAGVSASVEVFAPAASDTLERRSILTRIVDIDNLVMTRLMRDVYSNGVLNYTFKTYKKKAGVWSPLGSALVDGFLTPGGQYTIGVTILGDGSGSMYIMSGSTIIASGSWKAQADLATGGVLASGGYGIAHGVSDNGQANYPGTGIPGGANFENFSVREATSLPQDAAVYANRDLRLRWDKTLREASDGSGSLPEMGVYSGDRLLIPPSGREKRPVRVAILASRGLPEVDEDPQADDLKATLTVIPRVTEVPEAV